MGRFLYNNKLIMKYILTIICLLLSQLNQAQSITLVNGTDTLKVKVIGVSEGIPVSYDMCFDFIYQKIGQGFVTVGEDKWTQGFKAYSYIRHGYGYEWVHEYLTYDPCFDYTLIQIERYLNSQK